MIFTDSKKERQSNLNNKIWSPTKSGFIVALAWPETKCKLAGAWYDGLMNLVGINQGGYYRVGHAALLLISDEHQTCEYFDFGRYHAPYGFGRVRDKETDHDLAVKTKAVFSGDKRTIENIDQILRELSGSPSCHGNGTIHATYTRIDYNRAFAAAKKLQKRDFISYGPFIPYGTNCSRFVNNIIRAGDPSLAERLLLLLPYTISPTPMTNVKSLFSTVVRMGASYISMETQLKNLAPA